MSGTRRIGFSVTIVALLFTATFVVFWPTLSADFVQWDDELNIYANPHLRGLTFENLRWMFTDVTYARRYMPLAWLGWAVNHAVAGLEPRACHTGNLFFHAANAVLIYVLFARLLGAVTGEKAEAPDLRARTCAALGALLWAVHPLRVESVAWASARIYNQALFFALLSLVCYLRYATAPPERRRHLFLGLSAASLAASLFTYPIGLAVGVIPLVFDWYPLRRLRRESEGWWTRANARVVLEKIPYALREARNKPSCAESTDQPRRSARNAKRNALCFASSAPLRGQSGSPTHSSHSSRFVLRGPVAGARPARDGIVEKSHEVEVAWRDHSPGLRGNGLVRLRRGFRSRGPARHCRPQDRRLCRRSRQRRTQGQGRRV